VLKPQHVAGVDAYLGWRDIDVIVVIIGQSPRQISHRNVYKHSNRRLQSALHGGCD